MSNGEKSNAIELIKASRRTQIVGQLTAGVYHDFNNVLTIILAQAGMMELTMQPAEDSSAKRSIDSIRRSAERGARLIRRLSDFRNRRILGNGIADSEGIVQSVVDMLDRLLGDHVEISLKLGSVRRAVRADPASLEQSIVELIMNAQEAMPQGGRIEVKSEIIEIEEREYARISISDQGSGPNEEMERARRTPGLGDKPGHAGVGLFIVQSFIDETDGILAIESGPQNGTTVRLTLPLAPLT